MKKHKIGGHTVIEEDGGYIESIILNDVLLKHDVRLRDLWQHLKRKAQIARYNVNRVYPTAQRSAAFDYVRELEKAVEHLEEAFKNKKEYVKHIKNYEYQYDMIPTQEDIN